MSAKKRRDVYKYLGLWKLYTHKSSENNLKKNYDEYVCETTIMIR